MHPDLRECSFDRGFHSPANRKRLDELLDTAALPKKGRLNAADQERRSLVPSPQAAISGRGVTAINHLEHHGLSLRRHLRLPDGTKIGSCRRGGIWKYNSTKSFLDTPLTCKN